MATIRTAIQITDQMSPAFRNMTTEIDNVISSFESLQSRLQSQVTIPNVQETRREFQQVETSVNSIESEINQANSAQRQFNNSVRNGQSSVDALSGKLLNLVGAYIGLQGLKKLVNLSDTMAQTNARLELIVDDGGSVEELRNKIFASAEEARASYLDVSSTVSKLGLLAGKAFSGNDEIIKFTELMSKNFVIGGSSAIEQSAAMYQLTQAMAAGKLQGDEYRSIIENAPMLASAIEDYMVNVKKAEGSMKDWASDGLLTADVIKAAMFNAADETNKKFKQMPMTWGQVWTSAVNNFIYISQPILSFINLLAQNWSILQPIIIATVFALGLYLIATKGVALASAIFSAVQTFLSIGFGVLTGSTAAASAAMFTYNSALLACPITWIILGIIFIITVIYVFIAAMNKGAEHSVSATGVIAGSFMAVFAFIGNLFVSFCNLAIDVVAIVWNFIAIFVEFLANVFQDPLNSIVRMFTSMADCVLQILESLASAIDTVFGSNLADAVSGWRSSLKSRVVDMIGEPKVKIERIDSSSMHWDRFEYGKAYDKGYDFGKGIESKLKLPNLNSLKPDNSIMGQDQMMNDIGDTAKNTGAMKDKMDATSEELKYLRDLAEQEVINRFTTAEIKIEMKNNMKVNSNMDLDGIVTHLEDKLYEAMVVSAEGVS